MVFLRSTLIMADHRARRSMRSTGKARQHENTGVLGVLRGDVFLGDEVHPVAQWRHQPDPGDAVESAQSLPRDTLVDIADR